MAPVKRCNALFRSCGVMHWTRADVLSLHLQRVRPLPFRSQIKSCLTPGEPIRTRSLRATATGEPRTVSTMFLSFAAYMTVISPCPFGSSKCDSLLALASSEAVMTSHLMRLHPCRPDPLWLCCVIHHHATGWMFPPSLQPCLQYAFTCLISPLQPCLQLPPWPDSQVRPGHLPPLLPRVRRRHWFHQVPINAPRR